MTTIAKIFSVTILLVLSNFVLYGQKKDSSFVSHITVSQIDSICSSINNNKTLYEGIGEGEIYKGKKCIGGFSTYYLRDNVGIYRVKHESSTDLYYKYTFYYLDKLLIKATLVIEDWNTRNQMKTVCSAEYYFYNNKPLKITGENSKFSNASDILRKGLRYQQDNDN
jgi:hypothetical protein